MVRLDKPDKNAETILSSPCKKKVKIYSSDTKLNRKPNFFLKLVILVNEALTSNTAKLTLTLK